MRLASRPCSRRFSFCAVITRPMQYDTPYIRHFPTTLVVKETEGDGYRESVFRPHLKDPYTRELEHFHEAVTGDGVVKTTAEDYVEDMELFVEIIRAIQRGQG